MLDYVVRGGWLVDGTGAPGRRADVGIRDGRIAAVGTVTEQAGRVIDADGLTVHGQLFQRPGDGAKPGVTMGPVISAAHRAKVVAYIDKGVAEGYEKITDHLSGLTISKALRQLCDNARKV